MPKFQQLLQFWCIDNRSVVKQFGFQTLSAIGTKKFSFQTFLSVWNLNENDRLNVQKLNENGFIIFVVFLKYEIGFVPFSDVVSFVLFQTNQMFSFWMFWTFKMSKNQVLRQIFQARTSEIRTYWKSSQQISWFQGSNVFDHLKVYISRHAFNYVLWLPDHNMKCRLNL